MLVSMEITRVKISLMGNQIKQLGENAMKFPFAFLRIVGILVIVISIKAVNLAHLQGNGGDGQGFKLLVKVKKNQYVVGEPIPLFLTVTNINSEKIKYNSIPEKDCEILVKDQSGKLLPMTNYGKELSKRSDIGRLIEINGLTHDPLIVNHVYQITSAGEYSVAAKRTFIHPKTKKKIIIESNPVYVTVLDPPDQVIWGEPQHGIQLSATLSKKQVVLGEEVLLKVKVRNASQSRIVQLYDNIFWARLL